MGRRRELIDVGTGVSCGLMDDNAEKFLREELLDNR